MRTNGAGEGKKSEHGLSETSECNYITLLGYPTSNSEIYTILINFQAAEISCFHRFFIELQ